MVYLAGFPGIVHNIKLIKNMSAWRLLE